MTFKPKFQLNRAARAVIALAIGVIALPCLAQNAPSVSSAPGAPGTSSRPGVLVAQNVTDASGDSTNNVPVEQSAPLAASRGNPLADRPTSTPANTLATAPSLAQQLHPAPLLEEISRQSQALHAHMAASLVRVHLPEHNFAEAGPAEELLRKWERQLEPAVRQKLMEQTAALRAMQKAMIEEDPFAAARANADRMNSAVLVVRPFNPNELAEQMPGLNVPRGRVVAAGTLGVVMDDRGLVLVPAYVDRDLASQRAMHVTLPQGVLAEAVFVGSDRQTGLTLIRLAIPACTPARFAGHRPDEGSLVMTFPTQSDNVKLAVWTAGAHDPGLVVMPDGRVAGFANANQFLSAGAAEAVIRQLADHGGVHRAVLGIRVSEIRRDDPFRPQVAGLGSQPAMHVDKVQGGSPADRAGMHQGDLILSIAGDPVGDVPSFAAAIAAKAGTTEIRVLRDGQVVALNVALQQN